EFVVQKNRSWMMRDIELVGQDEVKEREEEFVIEVKEGMEEIRVSVMYKEEKGDFWGVEDMEEKEGERMKEEKEK
ncbi:hypothetical protein, partial [Bacillus thuringiensis]|uniref:hypothetical protein n=1 Tax=Bacillus thuringiensis TaxID=1428 RepID=UPI001642D142